MIQIAGLGAIAALALAACGPNETAAAPTTPAEAAAAASGLATELQKSQLDALAALGAAAGSNPQMAAFAASLAKVADVVASIKDEASAKAAGQALQPIYAEMDKQVKAIETMSEAEKQAAAMALTPQIAAAGMKIGMHLATLSPGLQEIVSKELDKMPDGPK